MDKQGKQVILTDTEMKLSGYSSPIDLEVFDVVAEHEANLREVNRLEEIRALDEVITHAERGKMVPEYGRVAARVAITSQLITEDTMRDHSVRLVDELEEYLAKN